MSNRRVVGTESATGGSTTSKGRNRTTLGVVLYAVGSYQGTAIPHNTAQQEGGTSHLKSRSESPRVMLERVANVPVCLMHTPQCVE